MSASRSILTTLHAALATLLMSGCGSDSRPSPDSSKAAPPAAESGGKGSSASLSILTWDEYFSDDLVAGFEAEFGIPVEFTTFANLDEMDGLLRSRPADFDLLVASAGTVGDLIEMEFLQPIRRDRLSGFDHLDERFLGLPFDEGNGYSVPYMWGTTLIAYRSDKIDEPEPSWRSLWNEAYRGRLLMLDDGFDVFAAALLADNRDLNSQNSEDLAAAADRLVEQVDRLDTRFVDVFEVRDKLISGECWIAMTYSSDAAVIAEEEENIAYFIPEEGAPLWIDSFVIPRESTNAEAAHLFLDYLCRPEVAAANSNALWSASANKSAREFLNEEVREDPTLYLDDESLARCRPEAQASPDRQLAVNRGLKRVFDRIREREALPAVTILTWENYLDPGVISRFEKEAGARVVAVEVENSERLKQEIASRPAEFDLVVADEATLKELIELKVLQELSSSSSSDLQTTGAINLASPSDPDHRYSLPYLWGTTILAGRREILSKVEPSWGLLWREDLRIALLDEPSDLVWIALLGLGMDPASATPDQIDEAVGRLGKRFPDLARHMMDPFAALDALESGAYDLVVTYNGDALARAAANPALAVAIPAEGAPLWIDSLAIVKDAPAPGLARRLIDFLVSPEISAATANALRYATPYETARRLIDPDLLGDPALYPTSDYAEKCRYVQFSKEASKHLGQAIPRILRGAPDPGVAAVAEEGRKPPPEIDPED
jgi:spermidine/putrescine transport system substrate-binding protein